MSFKIQSTMKNVNLHQNSLGSLLFLIYLQWKLDKNANVAIFVYYGKTQVAFRRRQLSW